MARSARALEASSAHCAYAFRSIEAAFRGKGLPAPPDAAWASLECPFFVTLNKATAEGNWSLRGCIGTLAPRPIQDIAKFARSSAFHDSRFEPLESEELPSLECAVSLLVKYEDGSSWDDWTVGTHGIIIEFESDGRAFRATYLPDVAEEQRWDKLTAIQSLVRKAGYGGACDESLLAAIKLTRYQSSKAALTYSEFSTTASA